MGHVQIPDIFAERRRLEDLGPRVMQAGLGLAALGVVLAFLAYYLAGETESSGARQLFFQSYLVGIAFATSLALGGLFVTLVHHLARAGWSTVVRRLAEGMAATILPLALLYVPLLIWGKDALFADWTTDWATLPVAERHPHWEHISHKHAWLNWNGFVTRWVIYFGLWSALALTFFRSSVRQDGSGDDAISRRMQMLSAPAMIVFALSLSFFAFDWLMSLDPTWYSTIFGVYYFAGTAMSGFAFLLIASYFLQRSGRLSHAITTEHYHDMGKFMFAFIVFWAYIGFSQYMLIWYGNLPEETTWFRPHHETASWGMASVLLVVGHFFLPFVALMSRNIKRNKALMAIGAAWMLFMQWFDLFWVVMPRFHSEAVPGILMPAALGVAFLGIFLAATAFNLRRCSLIAERDPRLAESLAFENI